MFDVKTPRRTFYLAADSEEDMHDWVNCICQVCNLQDLSKQTNERHCKFTSYYFFCTGTVLDKISFSDYNIGADAEQNKPNENPITYQSSRYLTNDSVIATDQPNVVSSSVDSTYQNDDFAFRHSMYSNRETILCDTKYPTSVFRATNNSVDSKVNYCNIGAVAEVISATESAYAAATSAGKQVELHQIYEKKMSLNENVTKDDARSLSGQLCSSSKSIVSSNEQRHSLTSIPIMRKVPQNLNLMSEQFVDPAVASTPEPSPALSTSSGPYIPISECFSGSPPFLMDNEPPMTPLNSLDPRFYDTPRSHMNIGLNLTNEQPYSPKRNNYAPVI